MSKRKNAPQTENTSAGYLARQPAMTLRSYEVGALPITNHILQTMRLRSLLKRCLLPPDDARTPLPPDRALLVLLRNILMSRELIYGLGQWACRRAPEGLVFWSEELEQLNDDRLGRYLDRLFDALGDELIMTVLHQVIDEVQVSLDELHNDSTTVSFYGAYKAAEEVGQVRGRPTLANNLGRSKHHPPHSKQLLDILTVTEDGGVSIYIEKRFSQLKTNFSLAPVNLKSVSRIQALLAVYFLVLIVQTLLKRDLRLAMQRADVTSLPLYPAGLSPAYDARGPRLVRWHSTSRAEDRCSVRGAEDPTIMSLATTAPEVVGHVAQE